MYCPLKITNMNWRPKNVFTFDELMVKPRKIENIQIVGPLLDLPVNQHSQFSPNVVKNGKIGCAGLAGRSKRALKNLIFSGLRPFTYFNLATYFMPDFA